MHSSAFMVRPLLLLSLLASTQAFAQQQASPPLFHVEIILFENLDSSRVEEDFFHGIDNPRLTPELARFPLPQLELETLVGFVPRAERDVRAEPPTETLPDTPDTGLLPVPEPPVDALEIIELASGQQSVPPDFLTPVPERFRVLARNELELDDVRADVYRRREYRVLGHAGWVQTGVDENEAIPVDLRLLGMTNPAGSIKVYLRRFLHVAIDLEFVDGRGAFWTAYPGTGLAELEYPRSYRHVFEHNAIRSGQLVYIDHPLFGLFVRITPAPDPVEPRPPTAVGGPAA